MARIGRDRIVTTAVALADERGLDAVSLRGIAERLAVTPMALYRHVRDKEDLLDAIAEELYAKLLLPRGARGWWDDLAALARSTRALLLRHPWAVPLFSRPPAGPHARSLDAALRGTLQRAGFSRSEAAELHGQLSNMVFALVMPEIHGRRNRAAFERGLDLLRAGLEGRLHSAGREAATRATRRRSGGAPPHEAS